MAQAKTQTKMSPREKLLQEVRLLMGGGMVNVELTPAHFDLAFDIALERYRLRSSNSVDERFTFLQLQPGQQLYTLPEEVIEVRQLLRRGSAGTVSGGGSQLDPFALAYTNQYLLNSGREGGLATYELFAGFQELIGRMFGMHIAHTYNDTTHELFIDRNILNQEDVLMWIYCYRPDDVLLKDGKARIWLRDYTTARSKFMLGEIRGKFQSIAGPQGGTSLNGDALKSEAQAEMERLENELANGIDADIGYGFIIG